MPTLQFKGKSLVQNHHLVVPFTELDPVKSRGLSKNPSLHDNLIIEGDNLKALKALLPTFHGKIKCIYIDPPYNTGNEGWIYNDKVNSPMMREWLGKTVDRDDLTRHDKWCCMMLPRLKLLRELLRDDGLLAISIDDNELSNLLDLCDEVFDRDNRFAVICVRNNPRGRRLGTQLAVEHEYLITYCKKIAAFEAGTLPLTEDQLAEYSETDSKGRKYRALGLRKRGALSTRKDRPNLHFPLYGNPTTKLVSLEPKKGFEKVIPKLSDKTEGVWRWSKNLIAENLDLLEARYVKRRGSGKEEVDIFERDYLDAISGEQATRLFPSIWRGSDFNNETGKDELKQLFGKAVLEYPKPVGLIQHLMLLANVRDDIVLDSFAGSGTTAHAVLERNASANHKARFILCQMPYETKEQEKNKENICETITAERVRRAASGVPKAKDDSLRKGLGGTFSYFRLGRELEKQAILDGKDLPSYEALAGYVFWTATGEEFQPKKLKQKEWFIGESREYDVFLLYDEKLETLKDMALTLEIAKKLPSVSGKRKLVFAPTKYLDQDYLDRLRITFCQLPFEIYQAAEPK